jgi:anti-sigma B factor antagonist
MVLDFDVRTVNRNGRAIVFVTGEIDLSVAARFRDALRVAQNESSDVIVDLTEVTFMDARGIDALVGAYKAAKNPSGLRVVAARPSVRRVFEITGTAELLLDPDSGTQLETPSQLSEGSVGG